MWNSHSLTGRAKYLESPSSVSFEDEGSQGSLHHSQHLWDGKAGSKQAKGMGQLLKLLQYEPSLTHGDSNQTASIIGLPHEYLGEIGGIKVW